MFYYIFIIWEVKLMVIKDIKISDKIFNGYG